ncbi:MAG: beta-lactamase family protein [Alphaproteobacteria bacterium]|nr:beta-lactamase family protein [Alphaproteobacteria bacterium]
MIKMIEDNPEKLGFDAKRLNHLTPFFQQYIDQKKIANFGILIARGGKIAYHKYRGTSAFNAGFKPNHKSLYRIFSMTKPITSIALMQLYEQGKLMLLDDITKFFPAFKNVKVFDGGTTTKYKTRDPDRMINVHDLMTHQSGLTYDFMMEHKVDALYRKAKIDGARSERYDLAGFVDALAEMPLIASPGDKWNYSVSTDVIGRIIEIVSGQPLDEYLEQHIFKPLGMKDTSFVVPDSKIKRLMHNYSRDPATRKIKLVDSPERTRLRAPCKFLSGGGGLVSTMEDYFRFTEMLRNGGKLGGKRIIGRTTLAHMLTNQLPNNATIPERAEGAFAEVTSEGTGYGLGFSVVINPGLVPMAGSLGNYSWGGIATTSFWNDPVEDMNVIFMTQLMPSRSYPIRTQLQQLVYAALK